MTISRRTLTTSAWATPLILSATPIPAYAASPQPESKPTGLYYNFPTPAATLTLADGSAPNRRINSLATTRRNTLVAAYGDWDRNSDSNIQPGKRIAITELDLINGHPVADPFPVGSEALSYYTQDSQGVLYYSTTDPSNKPAPGQLRGEVPGIIHDSTGEWAFTPLGINVAHVLGISITSDHTIFVGTGDWQGYGAIYSGRLGENFTPLIQFEGNRWGRIYKLWARQDGSELVFHARSLRDLRDGYYRMKVSDLTPKLLSGDIGQVWWNQTGQLMTFRTDGRIFNEDTRQEIQAPNPGKYYVPNAQSDTELYYLPSEGHYELETYNKLTGRKTTTPLAQAAEYFSIATLKNDNTLYLGDTAGYVHVHIMQ